ncbi:MAG: thiamine pyrophosphate-dependent dehydrogenase E1 component subunit alpha, partial [Parashewanella sp.]
VGRFKKWMLAQGWLTEEEDQALFGKYREEVLAQVKVSEKIGAPVIDDLINDVYDEPTPILKAQLDDLKQHIKKYPEAYPKTSGSI